MSAHETRGRKQQQKNPQVIIFHASLKKCMHIVRAEYILHFANGNIRTEACDYAS